MAGLLMDAVFSMLWTLMLKCESHLSSDKQNFTLLEHVKTNWCSGFSMVSFPIFSLRAKTTSSSSNTSFQSIQQASYNSHTCVPSIASPVSMTTQPVTFKLETCSVGSKLGLLRRLSAMSITKLDVASDKFLADNTANTFDSMSHSGRSGCCLASNGKYLRERL